MAPARTEHSSHDSTSKKRKQHHKQPYDAQEKALGVQKIKSSLRQTRRLLAKDKLAADVRVETERKLKALEADLVKAEASKKERTLAVKYHKVKFFERQKLVRKINQVKKKLAEDTSDALQNTLHDLRVDLNYVLHYPKSKKYISLFPPEARTHSSEKPQAPSHDPEREAVRIWVREKMENGELPSDPEAHLDSRPASDPSADSPWDKAAGQSKHGTTKGRKKEDEDDMAEGLDGDDFFGEDEDE